MRKHFDYTKSKSGFTMVELSLTLAFIGVLLITIAVITTNIVTIYQKGMALKAVNSVGRGLIDEFISSINSAPSVDTTSMCRSLLSDGATDDVLRACIANHANNFIYQSAYQTEDEGGRQLNGVFCTGSYSYFWNTYYGIEDGRTIGITYRDRSGKIENLPEDKDEAGNSKAELKDSEQVRLARIKDPNYRLCSASVNESTYEAYPDGTDKGGSYPGSNETKTANYIDMTNLYTNPTNASDYIPYLTEAPTQGMLNSFDLDLTLYELTIFPLSQDSVTLRTYMAGTFILSTLRGNVDIVRSGEYCQPNQVGVDKEGNPVEGDTSSLNNLGSEFNYCAVNKFNFAARTAGV